jgi:hypothetical protein
MIVAEKKTTAVRSRKAGAPLHLLSVTFHHHLEARDIHHFSAAFAANSGWKEHDKGYPLIQFQVHDGRASVMAINEGARRLRLALQPSALKKFTLQGKHFPLSIKERQEEHGFRIRVLPQKQMVPYRIYRCLPLDSDNYRKYKKLFSFRERLLLLEHLLEVSLLNVLNATGQPRPASPKVKAIIHQVDHVTDLKAFGNPYVAFDMTFSTNVELPDRIGLGQKCSIGYGWIFRKKEP